ncbi:MAG: hypothetical protein GWP10_05720, partial [Nitrospiraceae bacterium]|nr:hypothetical protein [Nitrospiraceae bacterium]
FLLIVEGKDDNKIWTQFLQKTGIDFLTNRVSVVSPGDSKDRNGGWRKAIEMGRFIKKARISTPFMIVLDSDNKSSRDKKEMALKNERFSTEAYHVLDEKEIESYLLDPAIISKTITHKTIDEIEEAINKSKRNGKEKLDDVFINFGLPKPDAGTKALLVANMDESDIRDEILSITNKIKIKIQFQDHRK